MHAAMLVPAMPATKAEAGTHMPVIAVLAITVVVSMSKYQRFLLSLG